MGERHLWAMETRVRRVPDVLLTRVMLLVGPSPLLQ